MGFRFRKSINLGGGIKLNLNKKSAGLSFGGKGFRYSMNTKGRKTTSVGIPGTGLYYTKSSGGNKKNSKYQKTANNFNPPSNGTPNSGNNYMSPPPIGNNEFNNNNQPQKSHNAAAIIWLILFFPIGLYIMWAKTNWNKIVKIVISVFFAFLMVLGIIGSFSDDDVPVSSSETITLDSSKTARIDEITRNAKDAVSSGITQEQTDEAINYIYHNYGNYFSSDDVMEQCIYYGAMLEYGYQKDYKTDLTAKTLTDLGQDVTQAAKGVYRGSDSETDEYTVSNLEQIKESLIYLGYEL